MGDANILGGVIKRAHLSSSYSLFFFINTENPQIGSYSTKQLAYIFQIQRSKKGRGTVSDLKRLKRVTKCNV